MLPMHLSKLSLSFIIDVFFLQTNHSIEIKMLYCQVEKAENIHTIHKYSNPFTIID